MTAPSDADDPLPAARQSRRLAAASAPAPPLRLGDHHRAILGALDETEVRRTGDIAERAGFLVTAGPSARRIASASCRSWLGELQTAGLVERVGDRDPIKWRRTADGTAMLGLLR